MKEISPHINYKNGIVYNFPDGKGVNRRYFVSEEGYDFKTLNNEDATFFNNYLTELISELKETYNFCNTLRQVVTMSISNYYNHKITPEEMTDLISSYQKTIDETIEKVKEYKNKKNPFGNQPFYYGTEINMILKTTNMRLLNEVDKYTSSSNEKLKDIERDLQIMTTKIKKETAIKQ